MEKIYEKIQKLLNTANGSVGGNEADVALKMAHELMNKHGITMSELTEADRTAELGVLGEWNKGDKAYKIWERRLASAMAKLFDCQIVYSGTRGTSKRSMKFLGREGNVKTSWLMYDWIHDKLWNDAKAKYIPYSASSCNAYCVGAADVIYDRVVDMKNKDSKETKEWGLVAYNEVEQLKNKLYPVLSHSKSSATIRDNGAYNSGCRDGKDIGLNKQFGLKALTA